MFKAGFGTSLRKTAAGSAKMNADPQPWMKCYGWPQY